MNPFKQSGSFAAAILAALVLTCSTATAQAEQSADAGAVPDFAHVQQQAMELKQSVLTFGENRRQELVAQTETTLAKFDRRIENLETNIAAHRDEMSSAAQRYADEMMHTLTRQRKDVADWFGALKGDSEETWDHIIYEFSVAYEEFYDSWENMEAQFGVDSL